MLVSRRADKLQTRLFQLGGLLGGSWDMPVWCLRPGAWDELFTCSGLTDGNTLAITAGVLFSLGARAQLWQAHA